MCILFELGTGPFCGSGMKIRLNVCDGISSRRHKGYLFHAGKINVFMQLVTQ